MSFIIRLYYESYPKIFKHHLNNISVILLHSVPLLLCKDDAIAIPTVLFAFFALEFYYSSLHLLNFLKKYFYLFIRLIFKIQMF